MAKIYGLFGSMTGKLADTVMSVRNGEQIARKYQPVVFNPSTPAQVAVRAKLKLLSQLSAVMAPVIAIRREGPVSARNLFTKENYGAATYADSQADITLTSIKLTRSVVALPVLDASNRVNNTVTVVLSRTPSLDIDRLVVAAFVKQEDNTLRFLSSRVVTNPGTLNDYSTEFDLGGTYEAVFYAYGVRDNTESARVAFGNMQALTAETVAKLITSRTLTESDITLTETQAATSLVPSGNAAVNPAPSDGNRTAKKK